MSKKITIVLGLFLIYVIGVVAYFNKDEVLNTFSSQESAPPTIVVVETTNGADLKVLPEVKTNSTKNSPLIELLQNSAVQKIVTLAFILCGIIQLINFFTNFKPESALLDIFPVGICFFLAYSWQKLAILVAGI